MTNIDKIDEIFRAVGRMEGRIDQICDLTHRVGRLESWLSWLKGGWAVLVAFVGYLLHGIGGR
jgi:hypothetical protein